MKAKQFTSNLAFGKTVRVNYQKRDRYGRILGTVFLPDGTNLNDAILANGYAWWYQKYSPSDSKLNQLEAKAKDNYEGLWSQPNPQAPWNYRKSKRHR
jgi:endonuclease YncB( thermonuclease family)